MRIWNSYLGMEHAFVSLMRLDWLGFNLFIKFCCFLLIRGRILEKKNEGQLLGRKTIVRELSQPSSGWLSGGREAMSVLNINLTESQNVCYILGLEY